MAVKLDPLQMNMLSVISDLESVPEGAYNIRQDGEKVARNTTANIDIVSKSDKDGIDIYIKPGTKHESVHIPVILSKSGFTDMVYNDFHIGEDADVVIVAGCGINNCGTQKSEHDGIHTFYCGKNSRVRYVEKHYGEGDGTGEKVLNPQTIVYMEEGSYLEMETIQIKGVDSTKRETRAVIGKNATLIIGEKIFTHGNQNAETYFDVKLDGEGAHTHVVSRSVARDNSKQVYYSNIYGNTACTGHTECDAIIMDNAKVDAIPEIHANNVEASLVHEAAIGKIAGEQLIKLETLGLTEKEAEDQIIAGFMK